MTSTLLPEGEATAPPPQAAAAGTARVPRRRATFTMRQSGRRISPFNVISLVVAIGFIALTVVPLLTVLMRLFWVDGQLTLQPLQATLGQDVLGLVFNTVVIVLASTVFAVLIGGGLAWLYQPTDARKGLFSDPLPLGAFLLPPAGGSVGWVLLVAASGGYVTGVGM